MNHFEQLRKVLQDILNDAGDGWQLAHYVIAVGLQRLDAEGQISNCAWMFSPADQPDYVTDGLLSAAEDMRACADIDDD